MNKSKIAIVMPCYKVKNHILDLLELVGQEVWRIYVIDDACPENTGKYVMDNTLDTRVKVIFHKENLGVGGAVMTGYKASLKDGADIIVKIDGDGQMDPSLIKYFIRPILLCNADYTKGNRFSNPEGLKAMPGVRLFGNSILSLITKVSSGYWNIFDPTNGYTAIHASVANMLPFEKISKRYFFETDMLFRLNISRAVVMDVPMSARYSEESSSLKINKIIGEFLFKHTLNLIKRIIYNYYLRDVSLASIELPLGLIMLFFGVIFGIYQWILSSQIGVPATAGTVMLSAMPIFIGIQLILAFLGYDISNVPRNPILTRDNSSTKIEE